MTVELRKTGISVVGDLPWGTHFCTFYETKQDLLDILVPYFKAGLESKEFCIWVIAHPLTEEEAKRALGEAVPDLDRHLSDENIEILNGLDWYLEKDAFDLVRVTSAWDAKLKIALARRYDGIRVSGDTFWLREKDWKDFGAYEKQLNESITDRPMTLLCTYPLARSGATEILNVARAHQFAIARRHGEWEVIETPELIQAKAEIKRLNEELEKRVIGRTSELRVANEELRNEITDRRQIDRELRESQQQYESLVHSIDGIVWEVDAETFSFTFVSKQAERMLGYPVAQWLEPNFWANHLHPDDRDWAVDFCVDATKRRVGHQLEYRMIAADGRVVWLRDHVTVNVRVDQPVRLRGVMFDITESKQAEQRLKQSESQLAEAQRLAHIGSWDCELASNTVTWSDELYRIFGLQSGQIDVARESMSFIHPEDRDLVLETVKSSVKNREPFSFYYRILRPDGDERILHTRGYIVSVEHGEPIRIFGTTQDVTELKRAEEKLKVTSEQLRALSASLESAREEEGVRIARAVHDELGSTLTRLKWDLELMGKELQGDEDADPSKLREEISGMVVLIDDTIDVVRRISAELRPNFLDDLGLVEAIRWHTRQFQKRTGILSEFNSSIEDLDLSREQSTAVFRIFEEALTNVLRHAQATRVDIKLEIDESKLIVTIQDDGQGITEDEKSDRWSLGLMGMRERAKLVNGEVDISGTEEKGTLVTVRVPVA